MEIQKQADSATDSKMKTIFRQPLTADSKAGTGEGAMIHAGECPSPSEPEKGKASAASDGNSTGEHHALTQSNSSFITTNATVWGCSGGGYLKPFLILDVIH